MAESSSDFRDVLLELIEASPEPVDHPSPDQWLAYHRGELTAEEEERLQEHLARCRDCFELAAGAAAFAQPDEEPSVGQDMETAALWRLLRPQLGPPAENVRSIDAGPRRRSRGFRLPTTLAAVFFLALVGMTAWNFQLRAPRPNVPVFDLAPVERAVGQDVTLPAGPGMLVFHPAEERPVYRLAIRDAATGRELSSYELRLNQDHALTLDLSAGLSPGRYRLELSDGDGKVLETHLLRVAE